MAACMAPPRDEAAELAIVGQKTAAAMSSEFSRISTAVVYADQMQAFSDTHEDCLTNAACDVISPSGGLSAERRRIAKAILLRQRAIDTLMTAYAAFEQEAKYDATADLQNSVKAASDAVAEYTSVLLATAPVAVVSVQALAKLAPRVGGWFASAKQGDRLQNANSLIGSVSREFAASLVEEQALFETLWTVSANRQQQFREELVRAELVSPSSVLTHLAESAGLTIDIPAAGHRGRDELKQNALTTAIEAVVIAQATDRKSSTIQAYRAAVNAFSKLADAHESFEDADRSKLDAVIWAIGELNTAIELVDGVRPGEH